MKHLLILITLLLLFTASAYVATASSMTVTMYVPCNNYNMDISPRCTAPVADFWLIENGWAGRLESGVEFTQRHLTPKIMLFEMEEVKYLVYEDKTVFIN